jgi:hypothetical protein
LPIAPPAGSPSGICLRLPPSAIESGFFRLTPRTNPNVKKSRHVRSPSASRRLAPAAGAEEIPPSSLAGSMIHTGPRVPHTKERDKNRPSYSREQALAPEGAGRLCLHGPIGAPRMGAPSTETSGAFFRRGLRLGRALGTFRGRRGLRAWNDPGNVGIIVRSQGTSPITLLLAPEQPLSLFFLPLLAA